MKDEGSSFWRSIPGILTGLAGAVAAIASLIAALSQAGMLGRGDRGSASESFVANSPDEPTRESASPADFAGRWSAPVSYPWDVVIEETLRIEVEQGRVSGSASYLGVPRPMESAQITGNRITFFTRVEEMLGDQVRGYENHYDGLIEGERIDFSLTDSRGQGPIRFTMRRE